MEESIINIQLVHSPTFLDSKSQKTFDGSELDNKGESFSKIYTLPLCITSNNQPSLVLFNRPICPLFDLVNPFAGNSLFMLGKRGNVPSLISLKIMEFL